MSKKTVWALTCERCEHEWLPRDPFTKPTAETLPRVCPKCKSPYWDRPRQTPKPAAKETRTKNRAKKSSR